MCRSSSSSSWSLLSRHRRVASMCVYCCLIACYSKFVCCCCYCRCAICCIVVCDQKKKIEPNWFLLNPMHLFMSHSLRFFLKMEQFALSLTLTALISWAPNAKFLASTQKKLSGRFYDVHCSKWNSLCTRPRKNILLFSFGYLKIFLVLIDHEINWQYIPLIVRPILCKT